MPNKDCLQVSLNVPPEHRERLLRLQAEFAAACNAVAPVAREHRCWNRVALHHLVYRGLRERFPQLGSQMACNAVYSVARVYRVLTGAPESPWCLERRPDQPLPLVRFQDDAPVYFDRHTLSIKNGVLSMFTLDGRLRFEISLGEADVRRFAGEALRDIVLLRIGERFVLQFFFGEKQALPGADESALLPGSVAVQPEGATA